MTNTITIRPFDKARDIPALSAIWLEASRLAHAFIGEARLLEQQKLIEEQYLPNAETWVACNQGKPVGFISLVGSFVAGLFVLPLAQGQGIGRLLIGHALDRAGELTLEVYTQNRHAMRFYEKLGFRELSRRPTDGQGLPFENAAMMIRRDDVPIRPSQTCCDKDSDQETASDRSVPFKD